MILCQRRVATPDLLDRLDRAVCLALTIGSEHAPRMAAVVDRLKASAPSGAVEPIATLHGDCHAKNILIDHGEAALIDLDNVALGPPLHDVGSFIAALLHDALASGRPAVAVSPAIDAFLDAYRKNVPWPIPDHMLAWHTATALVQERVSRAITRLKPGRLGLIGTLVDLADDLLGGPVTLDRRKQVRC